MWETVGQILGFVGVAFAIASYQMKTQKGVLIALGIGSAIFCMHYLLIGGTSGLVLNSIMIIRNIVFYFREKKWFHPVLFPAIFAVGMAVASAVFWEGFYSVFITAGLILNTVCVSFKNVQLLRISIMITGPLCFTYNLFAHSIAGMINESLIFLFTLFAIIRYARQEKNARLKSEGEDNFSMPPVDAE